MTTDNQPNPEAGQSPAQGAVNSEAPSVDSKGIADNSLNVPAKASADAPVEEFNKERALETIRVQREKERVLEAQLKDYKRLKAEEEKRVAAQMTETERLKKQADELAAHNAKLQADIWRRDAVAETGLPAVFSERLKGETKDEMLADARELLKALPPTQPKAPHLNNTNPNAAATTETDAQKRERLFGRQGNVFDDAVLREKGGGVVLIHKPE